jgi:hypothetical protein
MASPARYRANKVGFVSAIAARVDEPVAPVAAQQSHESPATMNGEAERTLLTVAEEYDDRATDPESVAVEIRAPRTEAAAPLGCPPTGAILTNGVSSSVA